MDVEIHSWEDVFRTDKIEDIRKLSAKLKRQSSSHAQEVQALVGEKHEEVISLAASIEQLLHDVVDQEQALRKLTASRPAHKFDIHNLADPNKTSNEVIQGRLVALADRFFAQRRLSYVARVLYIAKSVLVPSEQLRIREKRLKRLIDLWVESGDGVTQDIYHATLISREINPEKLIEDLTQARREVIKRDLANNNAAQAVSQVDSALFVLSQLTADLCRVRLSRRKLSESSELAPIADITDNLRAFPDACYSTGTTALPDHVGLSNLDVVENFRKTFETTFVTDSPSKAAAEYESIMSRTRDSVDPSQLAEILVAATDAFCAAFRTLVAQTAAELEDFTAWKKRILETQEELKRLKSRSTKQASIVDPALGIKLTKFVDEASNLLTEKAASAYQSARMKLIKDDADLAQVIKVVTELDTNFKAIGGEPDGAPLDVYDKLIGSMVDNWEPVAGADPDDPRGCLYLFCCLMDRTLEAHLWTPEVVSRVRSRVLERVESLNADMLPQTKLLLEGSEEPDQSRLLLRPLAI